MANHPNDSPSSLSAQVRKLGQAINAGNPQAAHSFRTLLTEEGMGYLKGNSLPRSEVETLISDVISDITVRLYNGQAIENPRAYFYRCLRSELDKRQSIRQRRKTQQHIPWDELTHDIPAEDEALPLDLEEDRLARIRFVQRLLQQVSSKCRKLLERIFLVEEDPNRPRSLPQIAQELNLGGLDSLKSTKSRCIKQTREQFFDQYKQFKYG